jgi:surface protein
MFDSAYSFNQPLNSFDTKNVTDMSFMLNCAFAFNQPLASFRTNKVVSFKAMFKNATVFNQDVLTFTVGGCACNLSGMFQGAITFKQNLTTWSGTVNKTSKVTNTLRGAACPRKHDPNLHARKQGPFRYPVL